MWPSATSSLLPLLFLAALPATVLAGDVLETTGFSTCVSDPQVQVTAFNVQYNKNTRNLVFDLAGTSKVSQKVTADLVVSAYGKQIYTRSFDPCSLGLSEICPGRLKERLLDSRDHPTADTFHSPRRHLFHLRRTPHSLAIRL